MMGDLIVVAGGLAGLGLVVAGLTLVDERTRGRLWKDRAPTRAGRGAGLLALAGLALVAISGGVFTG